MLRAAWRYRHFILSSIRAEFKAKVARSMLGALWLVLTPVAQALIFIVVLSEVLRARLPGMQSDSAYAVYVLSGMAAWSLFSEILGRSVTIFVDFAGQMKKIAFPRLCLPLIVLGSAIVNHALVLAASIGLFLVFGHPPSIALIAIPIGAVLIASLAFAIGLIAGVFHVFVRDVGQTIAVILPMWFWLTPIVYPSEALPERMRWVTALNPVEPLVRVYRSAMLYGEWPTLVSLVGPAILIAALLWLAAVLFQRASPDLVDAL